MTANRKADLQRKLTLAPVAKPPAGLAERIKREIPKDLRFNAETERERLSKAVAFNLRVAASILVLVSSAYLGLQLLSRLDEKQSVTQQSARIPVAVRAQPKVLTAPDAAKEETQVPAAPAGHSPAATDCCGLSACSRRRSHGSCGECECRRRAKGERNRDVRSRRFKIGSGRCGCRDDDIAGQRKRNALLREGQERPGCHFETAGRTHHAVGFSIACREAEDSRDGADGGRR